MIFSVIQTGKEAFDADFTITRHNTQIGYVKVREWSLARTGIIKGKLSDTVFEMKRNADLLNVVSPHDPQNKYSIQIHDQICGNIYHDSFKKGIFHSYTFDRMELKGQDFRRYGIGLGKDGNCSPIYFGERQIAQFTKDSEIINECYNFHCAALDEHSGLIALLFCCYSYITTCYKPGQTMSKSVRKSFSKTTNKYELQYYNIH